MLGRGEDSGVFLLCGPEGEMLRMVVEGARTSCEEKPLLTYARLSMRDPTQFECRQWPRRRNIPFHAMTEASPNAGSDDINHQVYTEADMAAMAERIQCEQREAAAASTAHA